MTSDNLIMPGDVYSYRCVNGQGYGYMIPVRTSAGWDFIDTYQLDIPSRKAGETGDDASIRRIIELGSGEHDGYVRRATSTYYHRNAYFGKTTVPCELRPLFNLNDYETASFRECADYDATDVVKFVPLYSEQHYDWHLGRTLGLCFVRKGAEKSIRCEFRSLLDEASCSIIVPYAETAAYLLGEVEGKLRELEGAGLSTQRDKADVAHLANRIRILSECTEELRAANREYMAGFRSTSDAGEKNTGDGEND